MFYFYSYVVLALIAWALLYGMWCGYFSREYYEQRYSTGDAAIGVIWAIIASFVWPLSLILVYFLCHRCKHGLRWRVR